MTRDGFLRGCLSQTRDAGWMLIQSAFSFVPLTQGVYRSISECDYIRRSRLDQTPAIQNKPKAIPCGTCFIGDERPDQNARLSCCCGLLGHGSGS
jgi:hypothetical protein